MSKKLSQKRSKAFDAARKQHSIEAAEDYTELIADLIAEYGEARIGVIAEHLGISHVTALRTVKRLQAEGYLITSPHKPVVLTPKGKRTASFAKSRHELLVEFFVKVGVPKQLAEIDVEGVEHHISKETLIYIQKFLKSST
ncbi:MAG: iron dependent repressor, metal binding and dimerization domain protein [Bdellovibrionota bacterium]